MISLRLVIYLVLLIVALIALIRRHYVAFSVMTFLALLMAAYLATQYFLGGEAL